MDVCYPALTTAALFFTFMVIDLIRRNYRALGSHFLLGAVAILLMLYLCQNDAEIIAWSLLAIPVIFLVLGFVIGAVAPAPGPAPAPAPAPATLVPSAVKPTYSPCYYCGGQPCICPVTQPASSSTGALKDTSGNVVVPAPTSALPTQQPPTTKSCGVDIHGNKTQCVDTRTLTSA
jgi:hypothetical protein